MLGAVDIGTGPLDWLRRSPTVSAPVATPADKPVSDLRLPETPIADETRAMLSPAAREALRSGNAGPAIKELRALALTGRTDAAAALQQLDEHPTGIDGK